MLITSVNNPKVKELVKLHDKKERDRQGKFFVEGLDIISEAYKCKCLLDLYILDGYDNPYPIDAVYVSRDVMKKISDMDSISPYFGVCKKLHEGKLGNKVIILDNIQDPGNLGTIIRSSVAFCFDTVVLGNNTVSIYNPKVLRSTKGMIFNIDIIECNDLASFIESLHDYFIFGTSVTNGVDIKKTNIPKKSAFIIGNEGNGISKEVLSRCDKNIYINMASECESLNAGVSASIIMYEVMNK